jgi:hypothetical protein
VHARMLSVELLQGLDVVSQEGVVHALACADRCGSVPVLTDDGFERELRGLDEGEPFGRRVRDELEVLGDEHVVRRTIGLLTLAPSF